MKESLHRAPKSPPVLYMPIISEKPGYLSPDESFHAVRVLRLAKNDSIRLIDGKGGLFEAVILTADPDRCMVLPEKQLQAPIRNYSLHLAIAPTKNIGRFEDFVEKAVEIGIDAITPLLCSRSERRSLPGDRLRKIILSAMKQAVVPLMPKLSTCTLFDDFVSLPMAEAEKFIAHCGSSERTALGHAYSKGKNAVILIGPEGDFTDNEVNLALKNGFTSISLGQNRLRTETAGVIACHTIHLVNSM